MPGSANSGTNTSTTVAVASTTPERTSLQARATTCRAGRGRAARRFSWSRRKTFSTSTTASSTSSPMAIASPPRVIVLIDSPSSLNTSTAASSDSGIATSEMAVVRTFSRNANSTTATRIAPSRRASPTLPSAASMKSAWRNRKRGAAMPGGRLPDTSASTASTARVRAMLSMPGCFCTDKITAGLPSKPAPPRATAGAKPTSATCDRRTGTPRGAPTGRLARSSMRRLRPMPRISHSCPWRSMKPPALLAAKPATAASTASSPTPSARIRAGSGITRHCFTPPPIGITWATPGTASRRGRSTQSAYSRTASGLARAGSMGSAISSTSPMIEAIGPSCGTTPAGRRSRTAARRSVTLWRLRQMSLPQSNSTYTSDSPTPDTERTRVTPGMPFIAVSRGKLTSCSTSSGAIPPASVIRVTVGLSRSGKTSTGRRCSPKAPATSSASAAASTNSRLARLQPTRRSKRLVRAGVIAPLPTGAHPAPPPARRA